MCAVMLTVQLPLSTFALGIWGGCTLWRLVAGIISAVVETVQFAHAATLRRLERRALASIQAQMHCVHCYRTSDVPGFACPACHSIHYDLTPGRLGIRRRICGCGTTLPLGIRVAAEQLTPMCPYCKRPQPSGAGARTVVTVPVFGAVGAGKTQFVSTAVVQLHHAAGQSGGKLTPLTSNSEGFLDTARTDAGAAPIKTPLIERPESLAYLWRRDDRDIEFQFMDAAGESFTQSEENRSLTYLDLAPVLVYVFDPLCLPEIHDRMRAAGLSAAQAGHIANTTAYGSVVDRLRNDGLDLSTKTLMMVVTKADLLRQIVSLPSGTLKSDDVRDWLQDNEADSFVRRAEVDFAACVYYAVDSTSLSPTSVDEIALRPLNIVGHLTERVASVPIVAHTTGADDNAASKADEPRRKPDNSPEEIMS